MSQEVKFTQEELDQIKLLQAKYTEIGNQLVQIKLAKKNAIEYLEKLDEQEDLLTTEIVEANQSEKLLAQELSSKYGAGSLDMETGLFVANTD
jgi:vacuolar-type H+-ATPase subunit I/STV1